MDARPPDRGPPAKTLQERLDSWKAIAAYLKRDVTTVQRWERREGMPVHRHLHDKQGSVYAFCSELDAWSAGRRMASAQNGESREEQAAPQGTGLEPLAAQRIAPIRWRRWLPIGFGGILLAAVLAAYWLAAGRDLFWRDPLANAKVTQLTDLSETAQAATISRDGRRVAFLAEGDGVSHKNFWLVDLQTSAERQLAELTPEPAIGDFDVSRGGDEIVFDRIERSSEIAMIERAH
jgi:hypothetical protein